MRAFSLLCHPFSLDAGYQLLAFVGLRSAFPDSHPLVAVSACRAFPSLCSFSPGGPSSSGRMRGSCGANLCFSYCFIASPGLPAGESHLWGARVLGLTNMVIQCNLSHIHRVPFLGFVTYPWRPHWAMDFYEAVVHAMTFIHLRYFFFPVFDSLPTTHTFSVGPEDIYTCCVNDLRGALAYPLGWCGEGHPCDCLLIADSAWLPCPSPSRKSVCLPFLLDGWLPLL